MKKVIVVLVIMLFCAGNLYAADKARVVPKNVKSESGLLNILNAVDDELDLLRTLINELRTDHATFKSSVDEIETWAETLAAGLNLDTGVAATTYDAVISNSAPASVSASAVTEQVIGGK